MSSNDARPYIQSLQRAITILRSFTESDPELGVNELSRRLDLHKSTVSRMITTLQHEGLVSQNPKTGKYRLGLGLVSLAGVALGQIDIRAAAQPFMGQLVEVSKETVNVTVLDGSECVNIDRIASPNPIRYVGWIGRRTPLHCTASGKVILAYLLEDLRKVHLSRPLVKYTPFTITDVKTLEATLPEICLAGYAIVHEEFEEGFSAMAAPIFNHLGAVAGTLSLSGPTYRLGPGTIETYLPSLMDTAQKISYEMGFRGHQQ